MSRIYVVDVSSVQIQADWKQVVAHDPGAAFGVPPGRIRGCIAKASEGPRGIDPETRVHLDGAREQGRFAAEFYTSVKTAYTLA